MNPDNRIMGRAAIWLAALALLLTGLACGLPFGVVGSDTVVEPADEKEGPAIDEEEPELAPAYGIDEAKQPEEEEPPADAEALYEQGRQLMHENEGEAALDLFEQAIEADPTYPGGYTGRATYKIQILDFEGARADLDKAIELDPDFYRAYHNRAVIAYLQNDYDAALADFNRAITIEPEDPLTLNGRGAVYAAMGSFDLALADYNKTIELDPENAAAFYNRALIYDAQGNVQSAIADFEQFLELEPEGEDADYARERITALGG